MATITLACGETVTVDDSDAERLSAHRWFLHKSAAGKKYAARRERVGHARRIIYLHREVAGAESDRISFVNGDALDCRFDNLRFYGKFRRASTIDKGAFAEAMVCAELLRNGFDVFLPFSGHSPADLVASLGAGRPLRWQIKYRKAAGGSINLTLRNVHANANGNKSKPIDMTMIDGFAIYCPDTDCVYYLPVSALTEGQQGVSIRLTEPLGKTAGKSRIGAAMTCPIEFYDTFFDTAGGK